METIARYERALADAGLPTTSFVSRLAELPETSRQVHQTLLRAFAETGTAPDPSAWLAGTAAAADAAATELAAANLLALDADGALIGVFPFSARPTRHRVEIRGGPTASAMCAVDALAISPMLGSDTTVTSVDPIAGTPITVEVCGSELKWQPDTAVVVLGRSGDGPICTACCAHIDFYGNEATAEEALRSIDGTILSIPSAHELGIALFAGLLLPQPG